MKLRSIICLLMMSFFLLQGCGALIGAGVGAGAAAAGYHYSQGNFQTTYNYPLDKAVDASLTGLKQSGVNVTGTDKDATRALIMGTRGSDKAPARVELKPRGPNSTEANIRVGKIGDEQASMAINRNIVDQFKGKA